MGEGAARSEVQATLPCRWSGGVVTRCTLAVVPVPSWAAHVWPCHLPPSIFFLILSIYVDPCKCEKEEKRKNLEHLSLSVD
jgi:hypothetical protein